MKRSKSNNGGFSLVELIVVIAIMAVLVGVLAPTLIGNIEKSRESKDLQNLDSIRQAVVTAMADEAVYTSVMSDINAAGTNTKAYSAASTSGVNITNSALSSAFAEIITADTKMTSTAGKEGSLTIEVNKSGAVKVYVTAGAGSSGHTYAYATKNKVEMISQ